VVGENLPPNFFIFILSGSWWNITSRILHFVQVAQFSRQMFVQHSILQFPKIYGIIYMYQRGTDLKNHKAKNFKNFLKNA
jgi:hypothetical protein